MTSATAWTVDDLLLPTLVATSTEATGEHVPEDPPLQARPRNAALDVAPVLLVSLFGSWFLVLGSWFLVLGARRGLDSRVPPSPPCKTLFPKVTLVSSLS
jgi:hypothetical protein